MSSIANAYAERVRETGPYFLDRLKTLASVPIVGNVHGSHFMLCIEFVKDQTTKEPFAEGVRIGRHVARAARSRGLIIRPIGNLAVLSPTLILTRPQIDRIVAILSESLDAVVADLTRQE